MPQLALPIRISKMLEADTGNALVAAGLIADLDPWALEAFDATASLFRGLCQRLNEWSAETRVNEKLLAIAADNGIDDKVLIARIQAGDVAGLDDAPALFRRLFTFEKIRIVVAAGQRYGAWGSSDIFRFRLSPAIGSLRMLAEAMALVTLFWEDDDLAARWFRLKDGKEGHEFFKETQPKVKEILKKYDVDKTYGIASGVAQHVRMSGIVRSLDTSNGVRLPDQDVGQDNYSFHLMVAHFHRIQARLLPALGSLLLDASDSWHQEADVFVKRTAALWSALEKRYSAEIVANGSTAEE